MKILVVTPWFPSDASPGTGIFNLRDVELLSSEHEVTVLHLHGPAVVGDSLASHVLPNGVRVDVLPFSMARPLTIWPAARRIRALARGVDLVHSMAFPAILPTKLSGISGKLPWVHTEHWSGMVVRPDTLRARLGSSVLRPFVKFPDETIVVGKDLGRAVDEYRGSARASTIIANFVRFDAQGRLPSEPPTPPASAHANDAASQTEASPLRLIAVAGIVARKGVLEAVRTIALLAERGVDARLEWVGEGELRAAAEQLALDLGVTDRVTFTGFLPPEQLTEHLLQSHVFMLPTDGETFGVAVAEALAVGLPVVTSGVGGHLGYLPPEASRIAEREPAALADAVQDLVDDETRWSAEQIVAHARSAFSEATRRQQYRDVYERAQQAVRR